MPLATKSPRTARRDQALSLLRTRVSGRDRSVAAAPRCVYAVMNFHRKEHTTAKGRNSDRSRAGPRRGPCKPAPPESRVYAVMNFHRKEHATAERRDSDRSRGRRGRILDCGGPAPLSRCSKAPGDWRSPKPGGQFNGSCVASLFMSWFMERVALIADCL